MSYDFGIGDESFNCTYNVSKMFYDWEPEKGIRSIYGVSGRDSIELLRSLREHLENNRSRMLLMEPDNGWGSLNNTHAMVNKMIMMSFDNLDDIWEGD